MSGRGLDHLIEQNETDLGFLSAYGGGESPEELLKLIAQSVCEGMEIEATDAVSYTHLTLPTICSV